MKDDEVVGRTADYVRAQLRSDSSGHDWWHVWRVRNLAVAIGRAEGADLRVVELAALLHDISDYKINGGDHERGPRIAYEWLVGAGAGAHASIVKDIIAGMSFMGAGTTSEMKTIEGKSVQDADWLDALGAVGAARAFAFGGFSGEVMHDPSMQPRLHATRYEYLSRNGTTLNHFHEKLFLLKDRMNTDAGRAAAAKRHDFLDTFMENFLSEWDALDVPGAEVGGDGA